MGLMSALNAAVSGLRTTQAGINLVAQNVANADSIGYSRRTMQPVQSIVGERTGGVRAGEIERILDTVLQRQLRLETSGAGYTNVKASFARSLDQLFGRPGGVNSLDGAVNAFSAAVTELFNNPADLSARMGLLDVGQRLTSTIGTIATSIQELRTGAEQRLASAVGQADALLQGIAAINARAATNAQGNVNAALADERDRLIDQLASLMDVQVHPGHDGTIRLTTSSGQTLLDSGGAARLTFDARAFVTAQMSYGDPTFGVGTVTAVSPSGTRVDLITGGAIRSGEIAALIEARDQTLVQAQRQLDELAAGLARSLSDRPAPVTVDAGAFSIDLTGLKPGNEITLEFEVGGVTRRALIVPTNGPLANPIPAAATADPGAIVVSFDLTGGIDATKAAAVAQALADAGVGVDVTFDAPALVFAGQAGTSVTRVAAGVTTNLADGFEQLPLFVDSGNSLFTGAFDGRPQLVGFAQRISVNSSLLANPNNLVQPGRPSGDMQRAQAMIDALTTNTRMFSPAGGITGGDVGFTTTVSAFARRLVETQGAGVENALRLDQGQRIALAAVESRFAEVSGVNIDSEMAQLVQLQTAYSANARVMTAVRDMMDMLLRI